MIHSFYKDLAEMPLLRTQIKTETKFHIYFQNDSGNIVIVNSFYNRNKNQQILFFDPFRRKLRKNWLILVAHKK